MKHIKDSVTIDELANFISEAVENLIFDDEKCCTFKLDDKLAICVGWSSCFGKARRNDIIQSISEPDFAIMVGIKDYRSDASMLTDYDWIDYPIVNGEAYDISEAISPKKDYFRLANYLIQEYKYLLNTNEYRHEIHDSENLGWIEEPEYLEEYDFYTPESKDYWIDILTKIKKAKTREEKSLIAREALDYISDFKNTDVKNEVKTDLMKIIKRR